MERKTVSGWKKLARRLIALALAAVIILPGLPISGMLGIGMVEAKAEENSEPGNPDNPGYFIRIYAGGGTLSGVDSRMECYTGPNGDGSNVITVYYLMASDEPEITLPTASKTDDVFVGWTYRDDTMSDFQDYSGTSFKLTKNIEFLPKWKSETDEPQPQNRIELIVWDGGSISNIGEGWTVIPLEGYNAIDYIYYSDEGKEIDLPTPTKEGDAFDGWYLRDENNKQYVKKYTDTKYKLTENIVMDSRWKSWDACKVRLFLSGGELSGSEWKKESYTGEDGSVTTWYSISSWEQPEITLPTPTKENCDFIGWQIRDESENKWVDYTGATYKLTKSSDFYAKFKDNRPKLCLLTDGGTITGLGNEWEYWEGLNPDGDFITEYYLISADKPVITLPTPVKEGCVFKGWQTWDSKAKKRVDYTGSTYTLTKSCNFFAKYEDSRKTLTLFAAGGSIDNSDNKWEFYSWTNDDGSTGTRYDLITLDEPEVTLPTPTKKGFDFVGWQIWDDSKEKWVDYTGSTYKLTKSCEFMAKFKDNRPVLKLFTAGGVITGLGDEWKYWEGLNGDGDFITEYYLRSADEPVITLPIPVKDGEAFKEWTYKDKESGKRLPFKESSYRLTESLELIAKYAVPVSEIRLSASSVTVKKGETVTLSANVLPADAEDPSVTWTTGDPETATVQDGVVTGVKAGTTAVTAKAGNKTAAAIVTVIEDSSAKEETETDLTDLIKDTGNGENLDNVIKDVVTTTTEGGETKTETKIWIGGLESSYTYTGDQIKPAIHVYDGVKKLTEKSDYTVKYKNNKDVGTNAGIEIKFKGNYAGTPDQNVTFTINKASLSESFIASDVAVQATGKELKPAVEVKWKATGKKLNAKAYKVTYEGGKDSITDAGKYTATILPVDTDNLEGSITATVTVIAKTEKNRDLSKGKIILKTNKKTWTGKEIRYGTDEITVNDSAGKKVNSSYYSVSYINNTDPGKATLIVTAKDSRDDGYVGSKSVTFSINKGKTEKNLDISISETAEYDPKGAMPVITVIDKDTNTVLNEGTDYKVTYKGNKTTGATALATIIGKGNYKFSTGKEFKVTAKNIDKVSVSATDVFDARNWNKSKLTITDNGKKLGSRDYEITGYSVGGSDITSAPEEGSTIKISIKGQAPNYTGTTEVCYRLVSSSQDISKAKEVNKLPNKVFTGDKVTLTDSDFDGVLKLGDKDLKAGINFRIVGYEKNDKKGTAKVTIVGIDSDGSILAGSKTLNFKITEKKGSWKSGGTKLIDGKWTN